MTKFVKSAEKLEKMDKALRRIVSRLEPKCSFCNKQTLNQKTLVCTSCGTTMPRNYGPSQRVDRHGRNLTE